MILLNQVCILKRNILTRQIEDHNRYIFIKNKSVFILLTPITHLAKLKFWMNGWLILNNVINMFQTFSYNHFWTSDNSSSTKSRSGNPGYQSGKPILMGYLTKNQSGENYFIDREGEKFLHVMKTSLNCEQANFTDRWKIFGFIATHSTK